MSDKPNPVPTPGEFFNWLGQFAQPWMDATASLGNQLPASNLNMPDPLAMWTNLQERGTQAWAEFMSKLVATPEFAAGLGRGATYQSTMREGVRKAAQAYLEAANMPTREDLSNVAAQIVALDAKVDDLQDRQEEGVIDLFTEKLDRVLQKLAALDTVGSRLEQLSGQEKQLDSLGTRLDRLAGIESRLDALEARLDKLAATMERSAAPAQVDEAPQEKAPLVEKAEPAVQPAQAEGAAKPRPARRKTK